MGILGYIKYSWRKFVKIQVEIDTNVFDRFEKYCKENGFVSLDNCLEEFLREQLEINAETVVVP